MGTAMFPPTMRVRVDNSMVNTPLEYETISRKNVRFLWADPSRESHTGLDRGRNVVVAVCLYERSLPLPFPKAMAASASASASEFTNYEDRRALGFRSRVSIWE